MKETEHLKKLMEAVDDFKNLDDYDIAFDWNASPPEVVEELNKSLEAYGIQIELDELTGSDWYGARIVKR